MKKLPFLVVLAVFGVSQSPLHAQTWEPTAGGTHNWNANGNWTAAFPNAEGAVVNLNINIAGNQNVDLQQDITVGILNLGDSNGSHAFTIRAGSPSTNTLFFNGAGSTAAQLNVRNTGTITNTISAPVTLLSDLNITLEPNLNAAFNTNSARLSFGDVVNIGSNTLIVSGGYSGPSDANQMSFGAITGNGRIINNSVSPLTFGGNDSGFTGTIVANGRGIGTSNTNTITIAAGTSFVNAAEMVMNGSLTASGNLGQAGGGIRQGSGSSIVTNPGARFTSNLMTFNGGTLEAASFGATAVADDDVDTGTGTDTPWRRGEEFIADTVAVINLNSGGSKISFSTAPTTAGTRLTATDVQREQGATVTVSYSGGTGTNPLGSSSGIRAEFLIGNANGFLVGAGGASGPQTMSIIPWMGVSDNSGNNAGINHPQQLATYGANGVRALTSGEYASSITAGVTTNVSTNTVAGGANAVINGLRYTGNFVTNIGAVNSLTITSGALLFTGFTGGIGAAGDANAGTLDFGTREAVVWANATNSNTAHDNTIGSAIAGSGGFTKTGAGNLTLTGTNTYTGLTTVASGMLQVGDGVVNSRLGVGDVTIAEGTILTLRTSGGNQNIIDDTGFVRLTLFGILNGVISIDGGISDTVAGLFFGNTQQAVGTWGSTLSSATNTNDTFFQGTGMLNVVPEPSVALLSLLGAAGLAVPRRRRKLA